ncbi:isochorismatase family cysteine hydrolase [Mesorhizobium sp. BAC0120]|uniref:isochorismatase family cysteine hydrolase n=1 Tax=Mesorhizobium sp. BAC0120 TaxID=3090670 RepID=UPI00298C0FCF|nr:isochorismatase family cysteine hydrolase [Mesorhizobium sp. BAC0120]MDW6023156.1 isochorismatase family cysteine hydrolase [Mesorhizobium sp. BAC0120]
MSADGLPFGPLDAGCVHLCIDMQRLFGDGSPWATPWMKRVLPNVRRIVEKRPSATIFTRFVPAEHAGDGVGTWRRYYEHWSSVTQQVIGPEMIELLPELAGFAPPAQVIDKRVYSPWTEGRLENLLAGSRVHTLVITGTETDICVLAAALGAIDRGYRVVLVTDALCSSSDEAHDALMTFYHQRLSQQVETADTKTVLSNWI